MKKMLWFPLLALALLSCGSGHSSESSTSSTHPSIDSSSSSSETVSTITFEVTLMRFDGNRDDLDQVFYFWGVCFFPDFMKDLLDVSSLIVGDAITLTYTGGWGMLDTYPSLFRIYGGNPISAEVSKKAEVVEATVTDGEIIAPEGVSMDDMADGYRAGTAIDDTYHRVDIADMQSGFLSCSALEKGRARSFYASDPRNAKQSPNIAWEGSTRW